MTYEPDPGAAFAVADDVENANPQRGESQRGAPSPCGSIAYPGGSLSRLRAPDCASDSMRSAWQAKYVVSRVGSVVLMHPPMNGTSIVLQRRVPHALNCGTRYSAAMQKLSNFQVRTPVIEGIHTPGIYVTCAVHAHLRRLVARHSKSSSATFNQSCRMLGRRRFGEHRFRKLTPARTVTLYVGIMMVMVMMMMHDLFHNL